MFVGGLRQWGPATSTVYTVQVQITAIHTFGEVDTEETFTFDFADLDQTLWDAWVARATIQSVGFRSKTDDDHTVSVTVTDNDGGVSLPINYCKHSCRNTNSLSL